MSLAEIGRIAALRLLEAIDDDLAPGLHTVPSPAGGAGVQLSPVS